MKPGIQARRNAWGQGFKEGKAVGRREMREAFNQYEAALRKLRGEVHDF